MTFSLIIEMRLQRSTMLKWQLHKRAIYKKKNSYMYIGFKEKSNSEVSFRLTQGNCTMNKTCCI